MTGDEMQELKIGDLIKQKRKSQVFIVSGNYNGRLTGVLTVNVTDPSDWAVVDRAGHTGLPEVEHDCGRTDGWHEPTCSLLRPELVPHKDADLNSMTAAVWNTMSGLERKLWANWWRGQGMFSFQCLNCGFPTATGQAGCDACRPVG